jgi:3-hydroxyisobutyrate dehydrogenase-like beta-hydroxyacid dehydrogenase
MTNLGILHPGQMGISVAATAQRSGCTVYWVSTGRSRQSHARADEHGLQDAGSLTNLCRICEIIVSVCPPHAAEEIASEVMEQGFQGVFVDANAIAPQRAQTIAAQVTSGGASFVDGGIIGNPAWKPGTTWLYLSGPMADQVAACFAAGPLGTEVMGAEVGKASALKMCYAAYTKGTTALLTTVFGAAAELGILDALMAEWGRGGSTAGQENERKVREVTAKAVTAKAWRFTGEMEEIAATFAAAGMPSGFHEAATEIYQRLAEFKDAPATPSIEQVLRALHAPAESNVHAASR